MSLSPRERDALSSIEAGLVAAAPELAKLLAAFTSLSASDDMPAREGIRGGLHRGATRLSRGARRLRQSVGLLRLGMTVWLLFSVAMVVTAVILSHGDIGRGCPGLPYTAPCAAPAPARSAPSQAAASHAKQGFRDRGGR